MSKLPENPPGDHALVPAFDASLGIPAKPGEEIVFANKTALEKANEEIEQNVGKTGLKYISEAAALASLFSRKNLRPDEIAALRRRSFDIVSKHLETVDRVLSGDTHWNPVQANLFKTLLERVMPKLSSVTVEDNSSKNKKLEDYSVEELEAIALGKRKEQAVDAVITESNAAAVDQAEKEAEKETAEIMIRELAKISTLSDAEKEYIESRIREEAEARKKE